MLTATRDHRDRILAADPRLLGRVFTWRELEWLVDGLTPDDVPGDTVEDRARAVRDVVASRRSLRAAPAGRLLDVADPVDGPPAALRWAVTEIESAVRAISTLLVPPPHNGSADDGTYPGDRVALTTDGV